MILIFNNEKVYGLNKHTYKRFVKSPVLPWTRQGFPFYRHAYFLKLSSNTFVINYKNYIIAQNILQSHHVITDAIYFTRELTCYKYFITHYFQFSKLNLSDWQNYYQIIVWKQHKGTKLVNKFIWVIKVAP